MPDWLGFGRRYPWLIGLLLALAFTAVDSFVRLRSYADLQGALDGTPAQDGRSPTGYVGGQRGLILPVDGMDGHHWIMQAQQMFAGDGPRIRHVEYDNAPDGREVHWAGLFRWWITAVAWVDHVASGHPIAISIERVAPYANTLLFCIVLVGLATLASRLGSVAVAALLLCMIAIRPFYSPFAVGFVDHHGLASVASMLSILLLLAGGGGWIRAGEYATDETRLPRPGRSRSGPEATQGQSRAAADSIAAWMLDRPHARRWFMASGIAGGMGLWISAATITPVLIGIGLGAILSTGWFARSMSPGERFSADPTLWRVWGFTGAATSLAFYLLEYAPAHFGMRLEVNHPLFALAWAGAGELLCRVSLWIRDGRVSASSREWYAFGASIAAAVALPAAVALFSGQTFWVADPMLWALHKDYINEFGGFIPFWRSVGWDTRLAHVSPLPLFCLALPLATWKQSWPRPARALLVLGWPSGLFALFLAFQQNRWWGMANGVWLGILPTTLVILAVVHAGRSRRIILGIAAASFAMLILPSPASRIREWTQLGFREEISWEEIVAMINRDVAQSISTVAGDSRPTVLSDPTSSTLLAYFGGFRTLGTLYWENLPGLRAAAAIYGAPTPERARELIRHHGVTHIVVFSWQAFAQEYALLSRNRRRGDTVPDDAFLWQMFRTGNIPPWLRRHPYDLPDDDRLQNQMVLIFEVVPD